MECKKFFDISEQNQYSICHCLAGLSFLDEFQQGCNEDEACALIDSSHPVMQMQWQKPSAGTYKINVDGAYKDSRGGIGILVCDQMGDIIAVASIPMQSLTGPEHAEIEAVLKALDFACELDLPRFVLESDCTAIVQAVHQGTKICPLWEISLLLPKLDAELLSV